MQKWEYLLLEVTKIYGIVKFVINGEVQPMLKNQPLHVVVTQIGKQGWEMVGVSGERDGQVYIFKRPARATQQLTQEAPVVAHQDAQVS
jgi:hypothetical protein